MTKADARIWLIEMASMDFGFDIPAWEEWVRAYYSLIPPKELEG